jgi:hypothetical protein
MIGRAVRSVTVRPFGTEPVAERLAVFASTQGSVDFIRQ